MHLQVSAPAATASSIHHCPRDLGLVHFEGLCELLDVSRPTLERLIRSDRTFPKLFRIGRQRYARFEDLQRWVDKKYGAIAA